MMIIAVAVGAARLQLSQMLKMLLSRFGHDPSSRFASPLDIRFAQMLRKAAGPK